MWANLIATVIASSAASALIYVLCLNLMARVWPQTRLRWETIVVLAVAVIISVSVTTFFREYTRLNPDTTRYMIWQCDSDEECSATLKEAATGEPSD